MVDLQIDFVKKWQSKRKSAGQKMHLTSHIRPVFEPLITMSQSLSKK